MTAAVSGHATTVDTPREVLGWWLATAKCTCGWTEKASGSDISQAAASAADCGAKHELEADPIPPSAGSASPATPRRRLPTWLLLVAMALIVLVAWSVKASSESEQWCRETEQFWRENPYDSNKKLEDAYTFQCH